MTEIIGAATLDDALNFLGERAAEAEARGEKNFIFCEDRLTLLAERAVLRAVGGTFFTEVTTFARFLAGGERVLSKTGSVAAISAIIAKNEEKLVCFRKGAAQAVYETIAQLSASCVDAGALRESAAQTEGTLQGKLNDLAFLSEQYREFLGANGWTDENGYLAMLPEKIARTDFSGTNVFFFAFSSFTKQAQAGVKAALRNAKSVTGIFMAGRSGLYTNESAHIFRALCEEEGEARPRMIKGALLPEALALRDGLFSPEIVSEPMKTERVRRFTAADETEEFTLVASLIRKYAGEGLRYRDMAVLVAGEEDFPALERAFSAYRIPFFADKKKSFSEHPFCRFVINLLAAVSDGVLLDEADAVASSAYFGNGDNYRNYLLKYGGWRGAVKRNIREEAKGYDREELLACREKMLALLSCFPGKGKASVYTQGVREVYQLCDCENVTETLQTYYTEEEKKFLSLTPLENALAEIEAVCGEETFTAREFCALLQNCLTALKISLIPESVDCVFAGDATESRFERVRVLFATGLTDDLPRAAEDSAVIDDGEIERLSSLKVEIQPAVAQVNARARESLALNLCAFTDALYLSYPLSKRESETVRGEIMEYAEKLFSFAPMPDLFPYDCCERRPAALGLLSLKNAFETGLDGDVRRFSSLCAALKQAGEATDLILSDGEKKRVPEAKALYFSGTVSPTTMEQYFSCPYRGFALQALKLREREEKTALDTDTGTFVHAVLEQTARRFHEIKDEEECRVFAKKAGEELLRTPRFSALLDTKAGEYTAARLVREGEETSAAAYRQLRDSAFRVRETEKEIFLPELGMKGKTDRVDVSDGYVRVIDYKTGGIDDAASAYYMGTKLQLQLYLRAATGEGERAAGAFYFPAADNFTASEEERFRMSGFFSGEKEVVSRMDCTVREGEKSRLFESVPAGKYTDKGMRQEDFDSFLDYALLVTKKARSEMEEGNVSPSPKEGVCAYCRLQSMCGFSGAARGKEQIKCAQIAEIAKREKGE